MREVSPRYREAIQAVSATESPLDLLEFHYGGMVRARMVRNTEDIVSNGQRYIACMFSFQPPDDQDQQSPKATLAVDNVSGELVRFFEQTHGAHGMQVRWLQVLPSTPDVVEIDVLLDLASLSISPSTINASIGYEDVLRTPAVSYPYTYATAPGLF